MVDAFVFKTVGLACISHRQNFPGRGCDKRYFVIRGILRNFRLSRLSRARRTRFRIQPSLEDVAEAVNLSPTHFQRAHSLCPETNIILSRARLVCICACASTMMPLKTSSIKTASLSKISTSACVTSPWTKSGMPLFCIASKTAAMFLTLVTPWAEFVVALAG